MNKVYPITAGIGVVLACGFDFIRTTMGKDRGKPAPTNPTSAPVDSLGLIEEELETIVAPTA